MGHWDILIASTGMPDASEIWSPLQFGSISGLNKLFSCCLSHLFS